MYLHINPNISLCHPPHTLPHPPLPRSKGTSLQCNFPFISSCMGFKLQLLCTPGATIMHCQPQPAPLDLNLAAQHRISTLGSGAGSHIFLGCPPPLFPRIIPKPGSTSLSHLAKRTACNNTNSWQLNIKYPDHPPLHLNSFIKKYVLIIYNMPDTLISLRVVLVRVKLQITDIIPASLNRE